jgi:hypothetical protein
MASHSASLVQLTHAKPCAQKLSPLGRTTQPHVPGVAPQLRLVPAQMSTAAVQIPWWGAGPQNGRLQTPPLHSASSQQPSIVRQVPSAHLRSRSGQHSPTGMQPPPHGCSERWQQSLCRMHSLSQSFLALPHLHLPLHFPLSQHRSFFLSHFFPRGTHLAPTFCGLDNSGRTLSTPHSDSFSAPRRVAIRPTLRERSSNRGSSIALSVEHLSAASLETRKCVVVIPFWNRAKLPHPTCG